MARHWKAFLKARRCFLLLSGKISWGGSVLLHILIVLMLAFTGILHSQQLKEDIVEIAFVGSSNGSGSVTGSGSGNGSGSGTGSGPGNGAAANPAIPPRIIKSLRPVYPAAEKTAHIEGTVLLRLLITAEGTVSNVDVLTSSGSQNLDLAARQACLKWRFSAARNSQGQQISCYANIPVTFKIKT